MPTAILFPGQGSQTDGMRELVERHEPELAELALAEVGDDPFALAGEGTAYAQPAILCASLAAWTRAGPPRRPRSSPATRSASSARWPPPARSSPPTRCGMAALRGPADAGGGRARARRRCSRCSATPTARGPPPTAGEVVIANDNGPTQLVVAGPPEALAATAAAGEGRRPADDPARRSAAPSTPPAMEPAVAPVPRGARPRSRSSRRTAPVFSSVYATLFGATADRIRDQLAAALMQPGPLARDARGPAPDRRPPVRRRRARARRWPAWCAAPSTTSRPTCSASGRPPMPELTAPRIGMAPVGAPARAARRRGQRHRHRRARDRGRQRRRSPPALGVTEDWIVGAHRRPRAAGRRRRRGRWPITRREAARAQRSRPPGSSRSSVDLVLVATMSHEQLTPERGRRWSPRGSAPPAPARSTSTPPAPGFVSALALAAGQVEAGRARTVLVVGADLMTRLTDPTTAAPRRSSATAPARSLVSACDGARRRRPGRARRRRRPRPTWSPPRARRRSCG